MILETDRLTLRPWRDDDLDPFAAMCGDREVMEFFPSLPSRDDCAALIARLQAHHDRHHFCMWALELRATGQFLGFTGLQHVPFEAAFTPAVELGWRLARDAWGHGYATEAARASIWHAFGPLHLPELVAFLIPANTRSAAVCERIGMHRDPAGDFDHPRVADGARSVGGHPQQRHVLYRLRPS